MGVVKRKIGGLHQINNLETLEIQDEWTPLEEGLKPVITTRRVASITIRLTRNVEDNDTNLPGYQPPLSVETSGARRQTTRRSPRPYSSGGYSQSYTRQGPPRRN